MAVNTFNNISNSLICAGKNAVINGGFDFWARGTTLNLTTTARPYLADRFLVRCDFTAGTASVSQQTFTAGTAPVSGYEGTYFQRLTGGTTNSYMETGTRLEDVRTFAGQTTTISFWAKASSAATFNVAFDQNFGTGGSATVSTTVGTVALTTSWQRFSLTVAVPSIASKTIGTSSYLWLYLYIGTSNSLSLDLWGVQWEAGSTATPFSRAGGTLQGELAACQRYYWRYTGGNGNYTGYGFGSAKSTTQAEIIVNNPVDMRIQPTSLDYSSLAVSDSVGPTVLTNLVISYSNYGKCTLTATVAAGLTQYRPYSLVTNGTQSGYLGINAEL